MIDPDVLRDAAEDLKNYYSEPYFPVGNEPKRRCVNITYEFRHRCNDNGSLIVVHKRFEDGRFGSPTSYSYETLEYCANRYREEQRRIKQVNMNAWSRMKTQMYFQCVGGRDFFKRLVDPK